MTTARTSTAAQITSTVVTMVITLSTAAGCGGGAAPSVAVDSTSGGEHADDGIAAARRASSLASSPAFLGAVHLCSALLEKDARESDRIYAPVCQGLGTAGSPPEWEAFAAFCRTGDPLTSFVGKSESQRLAALRSLEVGVVGIAPTCQVRDPIDVGASFGSRERGAMPAGIETIVAGLGQFLEERAREELEIYLADSLRPLLCDAPSNEVLGLAPRDVLRSSCAVLDGYRPTDSRRSHSLSWDALRDALETDLRRLPEALANSELLARPEAMPVRLALYFVAELRSTTDPSLLLARLVDRLLAEESLPAPLRIAGTVVRAVMRIAGLQRVSETTMIGIATSVALELLPPESDADRITPAALVESATAAAAQATRLANGGHPEPANSGWSIDTTLISALLDASLPLEGALDRICAGDRDGVCEQLPALSAANVGLARVEQRVIAGRHLVECAASQNRQHVRDAVTRAVQDAGVSDYHEGQGNCGDWSARRARFEQASLGALAALPAVANLKIVLEALPAASLTTRLATRIGSPQLTARELAGLAVVLAPARSELRILECTGEPCPRTRAAIDWSGLHVSEVAPGDPAARRASLIMAALGETRTEAARALAELVEAINATLEVIRDPDTSLEVRAEQVTAVLGHYARAVELAVRLIGGRESFSLPASFPNLLQAVVGGDPGRILVASLDIVVEILGQVDIDDRIVRALGFASQVVQAATPDEVQEAVHSFAAPAGSYRAKRYDGGPRLYINGLVGFTGGVEYYFGRGHASQLTEAWALGAHASLGLYVNLWTFDGPWPRDFGRWSVGAYIPIIDATPYTTLPLQNETNLESADALSVISPGLYICLGIGESPFVLAFGASFTPRGRSLTYPAVAGDEGASRVEVVRVQAILGADITILPF